MNRTDYFSQRGSLTARNTNYMSDTLNWKFYKSLYKSGHKRHRMTLSDMRDRLKKNKHRNNKKYQDPKYKIRLYDYNKEPK
jgi:hypothetical protein